LVETVHFKLKSYRYGLLTGMLLSMGQIGVLFTMPLLLQNGKHLSAQESGLWLLPSGIFVIIGSQMGSRLTRRVGAAVVVRVGFILEAAGIALLALATTNHVTLVGYLPGFILYGGGLGFAGAQLTNVVLSEIPDRSSGVASGASTTARQIGGGLGVAVMGALVTVQTIHATARTVTASSLPADVKTRALVAVHQMGPNFAPPPGVTSQQSGSLQSALETGLVHGVRFALVFAACVVAFAAAMSFKIPRHAPATRDAVTEAEDESGLEAAAPAAVLH
jgi:hypothetical protein